MPTNADAYRAILIWLAAGWPLLAELPSDEYYDFAPMIQRMEALATKRLEAIEQELLQEAQHAR